MNTVTLYRVDDTSAEDETPKLWSIQAEELPKTYKLLGRAWGFKDHRLILKDDMRRYHVSLRSAEAVDLWRSYIQAKHKLHDSLSRKMLRLLDQEPKLSES